MRQNGLEAAILKLAAANVPVLGICGGYQMLGESIEDPDGEEGGGSLHGMGLLPVRTVFGKEKVQTRVTGEILQNPGAGDGLFAALCGSVFSGYEIHMGETALTDECQSVMTLHKDGGNVVDGAVTADGLAFGTYLHGLFDSDDFTRALVNGLRERKGLAPLDSTFHYAQYKSQQFDLLADAMRQHIDIEKIYTIMQNHQEPV